MRFIKQKQISKQIIKKMIILFNIVLINLIICNNNTFAVTVGDSIKLTVDDIFNINNNQSFIVPIKSSNNIHMISFTIKNFVGLVGADLNNKNYYNSGDFRHEVVKSGNDYKFYLINLSGNTLNKNGIVVELVLNVSITNKNDIIKFTDIYVDDKFINELSFQINNPNGIGGDAAITPQPIVVNNITSGGGGGGGGGIYINTLFNKNNNKLNDTKSDVMISKYFDCSDVYIVDIDNHWAKNIIIDLKNKCIVSSFGSDKKNRKFYPDLPIYRGEALKMILRAKNIDVNTNISDSGFSDVSKDSPYFNYVVKAKELGIIEGYKDGTFRPKDFITRSQALKIIALTLSISKEKLNNKDYSNAYKKYTDVSPLFWDISYINYFTAINFVQGYIDKTFRPNGNITRAEFAKLVYKVLYEKLN